MAEQRYQVVQAVIANGGTVTEVAEAYRVERIAYDGEHRESLLCIGVGLRWNATTYADNAATWNTTQVGVWKNECCNERVLVKIVPG